MGHELQIGITQSGIIHTDADAPLDVDTQFQMVKDSGAYDYVDKTPPEAEVDDYLRASEKHGLPILAGGWYYTLGADEALLKKNLEIGRRLGSRVHNTQIGSNHADGHLVTDREVADCYLEAYDIGMALGVVPCFEIHVNMWSEDFRRIVPVADLVAAAGIPFHMTLDHSHVIFKIDNPEAQEVFNIRPDVENGTLILDPYKPGNIVDEWIERGYVHHAHARAAVPNGPPNVWELDANGKPGRGIQYPFIRPEPGQFHSPWDEAQLEPWKECVRHLLAYHASHDDSRLGQISTEFIPWYDYGGGAKYSIFENGVACARWIRKTWEETQA